MERILIVDDSATARMFVIRCLQIIGYDGSVLVEAASGAEALRLLKEQSVSLVITDLNMPELDGTSLIRRIKANPRLNSIPVIVISSGLNQAKKHELLEMGVEAVLDKPLSPPMIQQAIALLGKGREGAVTNGW